MVIALVKFRIFVFQKQGEKMGIKMPDIDKIMVEDVVKGGGDEKRRNEQAAATKAGTARSFTIMDSRCRRFQSTTATGKHWTNNEGKEQGTMRGTVSGGLPHYFPKMGGVGETEI